MRQPEYSLDPSPYGHLHRWTVFDCDPEKAPRGHAQWINKQFNHSVAAKWFRSLGSSVTSGQLRDAAKQ